MKAPRTVTLVLAAVLLLPATAWAGDHTWKTPIDGWFHVGSNWTDGSAPTAGDTVGFGVAGPYQIWWDSTTGDRTTQGMTLSDGDVTFRIGDPAGSPHTWTITDSGPSSADATITGAALTLGLTGHTGVLILDIDDALTVDDGGTLNVIMGNEARCSTTTVGFTGTGSLAIASGGGVFNSTGYVGLITGSTGTVSVDGGTWTNSGSLHVGFWGEGELTIEGGGSVSNGNGYVTYLSGSTGTVTVDGGTWTNADDLDVGSYGEGTLTVTGGGSVSSTDGYVGRESGSTGTVAVTGADSTWQNSRNLYLGGTGTDDGGDASVELTTGGRVYVGDIDPATFSLLGGFSAVVVSDGDTTGGELLLRNGATLTNDYTAFLGYNAGETGAATVTGASWTNDVALYVGYQSEGELAIESGGSVSNFYGHVAYGSDSTGTVTIDGGTWTNSGPVYVGYSGEGELSIAGGGSVSNSYAYVGAESGSTGTVTVDGGTWTNSDDLFVAGGSTAPGGTGTVTVLAGGLVEVGDTLKVVWGGGTVNLQSGGSIVAGTFDNSTAGTFNFTGGTLAVTTFLGDLVCAGGTIAPGASPGTTTVSGDLTMDSGTIAIELAGAAPGAYDAVHVAGTATLGGTLAVGLVGPYRPSHNDAFQVMTFASRGGTTFDEHQGLDLGERLALTPTCGATDLVLVAVQGGPGEWGVDADGDASVPANWSAGLPNGVGDVATFGSAISAPREVTVDVPTTLGGIQFDSAQAYALAGPNPLTFETEAGAAAIHVADLAATHAIAADVVLADALDIDVAELGTLVFEGLLDNSAGQTITKTGDGTLVINGPQDHAPATVFEILGGTVDLNSEAGGAGTANLSVLVDDAVLHFGCDQHLDTLTLQNGALVRFTGANVVVLNHLVMNGIDLGGVTLTPEPATLLLMGAGLALAIAWKHSGSPGLTAGAPTKRYLRRGAK